MTNKKPESHPAESITPPAKTDGSGLAIASLILGVMSFCGFFIFTAIPAIITGIISLKCGQKERAMSIAGIILGSIATLLSLLFVLVVLVMILVGSNFDYVPQMDEGTYYEDSSMPVESSRT